MIGDDSLAVILANSGVTDGALDEASARELADALGFDPVSRDGFLVLELAKLADGDGKAAPKASSSFGSASGISISTARRSGLPS